MRFESGDVLVVRNVSVFLNGRLALQVFAADEAAGYIEVYTLDENMRVKLDVSRTKACTHRRYGRVNLLKRS